MSLPFLSAKLEKSWGEISRETMKMPPLSKKAFEFRFLLRGVFFSKKKSKRSRTNIVFYICPTF
jgi:hypothetical protein